MSFRSKAREIKERGVEERGNFTPEGAPLRVYNWWLQESPGDKAEQIKAGYRKENFCHYWRVVLIWAPLLWLFIHTAETGAKVVENRAVQVFALVLAAIGVVFLFLSFGLVRNVLLIGILGAVVLTLAIWGAVSGAALGMSEQQRTIHDMPEPVFNKVGAVVGFPTAVIAWVITKIVNNWKPAFTTAVLYLIFAAAIVAVVFFVVLAIIDFGIIHVLLYAGGLVLALLALVAVIAGVVGLADYIKGRRSLAKERARALDEEYYDEHGEYPVREAREPGKIAKFFTGLADFLIFATQVVRVKKWKICPLVEVGNHNVDESLDY